MNDRGRTIGGFTLVELLVAMAIATILVAVVVPVMVQSRNRARAAACVSNLRQVGEALALYTQDYNDRLPNLPATAFAASLPSEQWPGGSCATAARRLLEKHTTGGSVFRCANDVGAVEYGFDRAGGSVYSRAGSSYAPWSTARKGRFGVSANGALVSALNPPTVHVMFRDYGSSWHGRSNRSGLTVRAVSLVNAVYADGHARSTPVFEFDTEAGSYACTAVKLPRRGVIIALSGQADGGYAELTGRYHVGTDTNGRTYLKMQLSGAIWSAGRVHEVDREFTFGEESGLESALRQVVFWIDNLLGA